MVQHGMPSSQSDSSTVCWLLNCRAQGAAQAEAWCLQSPKPVGLCTTKH